MKTLTLAIKNTKEILRDPISLFFGLGFPLVLLLLLSAIQANIPVSLFEIESLTPGIAVFGLSFMTLFSATVISKDRGSALLERLYTAPLTPLNFILGYTLPMIPISLAQGAVCYIAALVLGLEISVGILWAWVFLIPVALFNIALGLLFGSILNDKAVGGVCGALLTNLSAWLSGIWFDLNLLGGAFKSIAYFLPFAHSVDMGRCALTGNFGEAFSHLWWVLGYTVVAFALAVFLFLRQMKKR